jgi:hypothetical protein
MRIGSNWEKQEDYLGKDTSWTIDGQERANGISPFIVAGIITTPADTTPETFLQLYIINIIKKLMPNATIKSSAVIQHEGRQMIRIEYSTPIPGSGDMHVVTVATKITQGFVGVSYTAENPTFESEVAKIEPYLLTLAPA